MASNYGQLTSVIYCSLMFACIGIYSSHLDNFWDLFFFGQCGRENKYRRFHNDTRRFTKEINFFFNFSWSEIFVSTSQRDRPLASDVHIKDTTRINTSLDLDLEWCMIFYP